MSYTYTSDDIRHNLQIAAQPAISTNPDLLDVVIQGLAVDFAVSRVTERRIRNAASTLALPVDFVETLVAAMAGPR